MQVAVDGFRPSRSKGQCFLRDPRYVDRIVEAVAPKPDETLLEIGGGTGQLTLPMARSGARVLTIEPDARLAEELRRSAKDVSDRIEIVEDDARDLDLRELLKSRGLEKLRVCGNLPYSVAAPILLRLLAHADLFTELTLMFQNEVAERLIAPPATKEYGFLSVVARRAASVRVLFRIPPHAFWPRPRVVSALLRFDLLGENTPDVGDQQLFRSLVRGLLTHRRKTIGNNVRRLGPNGPSPKATSEALAALGIDPGRRAETLNVEEFAALSRICSSLA